MEGSKHGLIEGIILAFTGQGLKKGIKNFTHNRQHLNADSNKATPARKSQASQP